MSLPTGERTFFHARGANAMKDAENAGADYLKTREMRVKYINAAVKQKIKLFGSIGKY